jgi:uracil phosphoribosyltransferase
MLNRKSIFTAVAALFVSAAPYAIAADGQETKQMESTADLIRANRDNPKALAELLPIVRSAVNPTAYEEVLMTKLRDKNTGMKEFRETAAKLGSILIGKVVDCLSLSPVTIATPIGDTTGLAINSRIDLVSIMRSGDALLEVFETYFPEANISKILIQRNEETAEPMFKYMKLAPTIGPDATVVITEPLVATGGTLGVAIGLLKERGVKEENIIIASICTAPEGLAILSEMYPNIKVVTIVMDDHLNEKKYIVPGLGDFGDRFFGTVH